MDVVALLALVVSALALLVSGYGAFQSRRDGRRVSYGAVVEMLDATRPARALLRNWADVTYPQFEQNDPSTFPSAEDIRADLASAPDVEAAVDQICRAFDLVGFLDRRRLIERYVVDEMYASPLMALWTPWLRAHVGSGDRGPTHFWELARLVDRVQHVPGRHPGVSGSAHWPKSPRRQA